jgi:glycosyltransferase involved in cell wall biosynthesis
MPSALLFHPSADLYGSDQTLVDLVRGLRNSDWEIDVALPCIGPLVEKLEECGARIHLGRFTAFGRSTLRPMSLLAFPFRFAWSTFGCFQLIRSTAPDLVHINTLLLPAPALAGRLASIPVVWHIHEIMEQPKLLACWIAWTVGKLSDRVVCNSAATFQWLLGQNPAIEDHGTVITNGVGTQEGGPDQDFRRDQNLPEGRFTFLFVGRLNMWKGQELFVEACARVLEQHPDTLFIAAGDAPPGQVHFRESFLDLIASLRLGDSFRWLGFRSDTPALYRASDVVVVPSTLPEPFGLVAAEAMAASRPVIAAGHGGLGDIVDDGATGLHVVPGDLDSLVGAMRELLLDPDRAKRMGKAGLARQKLHFSTERYQRQFIELYGQVCRGDLVT